MKNYVSGFIFSLILTITAYVLVVQHLLSGGMLILVISGLGLIQVLAQLIFFLHLDQEGKPRLNLAALLSTIGVMLILVVGSIWIMNNLNYRHMTPTQINSQILQTEGFQK